MDKTDIISNCQKLLSAYKSGLLGQTIMPEDSSPDFTEQQKETRLVYFTLPMSLNYQRDSYKLWEAVLKTFNDNETKNVFDIKYSANIDESELRKLLLKHKVALQPNKHIATWQKISKTIFDNWGSIENLLESVDYDFLKLRDVIQKEFKKGFPYISGVKIFNYWSFIIQEYGKIKLKNAEYIEIAPDTHITKCSVILGVITQEESESLSKEEISKRWREILKGTVINPIDMHPPLWFWSRNGFKFKLK
jgi:hypothetical protein